MAKKSTNIDITKLGPQGYRKLQEANNVIYAQNDPDMAEFMKGYLPLGSNMNPYQNAPKEIDIPSPQGIAWGESQYDEPNTTLSGLEHLQDIRAENQPWYDAMGNAVAKMLGTAATTLVSSIGGAIVGIPTAISEKRVSGLWDNELTQALSDVDNWFENNFKIYQTEEQENAPWLSLTNLTSASFWGDDVIKNAGFMLGAAASGSMFTGGLGMVSRALNFAGKATNASKVTTGILGSLFSAAGEGAIEAKQTMESLVELNNQKLDDELGKLAIQYQQEYESTKGTLVKGADGAYYDPAYEKYKTRMNELSNRRELGRQQILQDARSAGNWDMALNIPILTIGNFINLGKGFTKSYANARKALEASNKVSGASLIGGVNRGKFAEAFSRASRGEAIEGVESTLKNTGLRKAWAVAKPIITEGSEEMNQQWASSFAGYYKGNREDVNDYWKARMNPGSEQETMSALTAIGKGFFDSWGSYDQWEQFFVGGLTGGVGMAMPTKAFNQDKTKKKYDPRRYFSWEGGSFQNLKDLNNRLNEATQANEALNNRYKDPNFWNRIRSAVSHSYFQSTMDDAVANDDIKSYKDAEEKQFVQDLDAFVKAGKVDDFRALIGAATQDLSDTDIDDLISRNTVTITKEQDEANKKKQLDLEYDSLQDQYANELNNKNRPEVLRNIQSAMLQNRAAYDNVVGEEQKIGLYTDTYGNLTKTHDEIRKELQDNGEKLNKRVDDYLKSVTIVNRMSQGKLTSDQEGNLAYLHYMGNASMNRARSIFDKWYVPDNFNIQPNEKDNVESLQKVIPNATITANEDGTININTSNLNEEERKDIFLNFGLGYNQETAQKNAEVAYRESQFNPEAVSDYADATKLVLDSREFMKTFSEYMAEPTKVNEDKTKAEKSAEKEINNSSIDEKLVSEIVEGAENGDIDISSDEFDFTDDEMDIINGKTPDATVTPEIERKQKVNTAKEIINTKNQAKAKARSLGLDDATITDIDSMIDRAASSSESADDVLDLDTEAYNDPNTLTTTDEEQQLLQVAQDANSSPEEIDDAVAAYESSRQQRIDDIKNILSQIKEGVANDLEELKNMPKSGPNSPRIVRTFDDNKSKDPTEATPTANKKSDSNEATNDEDAPTPDIQALNLEEQPNSQPKQMPEKGYWKGNTTEYPIHRDKTNNKPFYEQIDDKTRQAISKAIYTFLKESGAYERIKNNEIKPGQKVRFAISKKLTNSINNTTGQGTPVILVVDENNNILCDLPCPACVTIFNRYPGLKEFYDEAVKYTNEHFNDNVDEDLIIIPNFESSVSRPYIGRPLYSANDVRHTLNEIANGKPFKMGIALTSSPNPTMVMTPGRRKAQGPSKEDLTIVRPESGLAGQPYLLIETSDPNRKWLTVPITMPTFSATGGARLTRMVVEHLLQLSNPQDLLTEEQQIAWKNGLRDLLSIGDIYLEIKQKPDNSGYTVNFRIKRLKSDTAWTTVFNGEAGAGDLLMQRVESLNIPYQVSRKYINSQFNGQDYNSLIGELASTNLEIGALHTVNDFFTINPIINGKQQKAKPIQDAPRDAENKAIATRENTFVTGNIVPDQANVDRSRTDGNYYYIKESDGKYHKYQRVHNILPVNSNNTGGANSQRALRTGSAVDTIVRDFFNTGKTTKPDFMSDEAYNNVLKYLNTLNKWLKDHKWTVYANNIVLYNKYPDGRRIAGEVDLLLVDDKGNYHIYDVKTSAGSFTGDYFEGVHPNWGQVMSTKDYYTAQVSSYAKLLYDRFGKKATGVAIIPFNTVYDDNNNVIGITKVPNIELPIVDVNNNFKSATPEASKVSASGSDRTISIPEYLDSSTEEHYNKKSSWEYYRDDLQRTYSGITYVTGESYKGTIEPAVKLAIDAGVLSPKYKKYLGRTRDNAIELEDLQEIIDEFHKLGINSPKELLEFIRTNVGKNTKDLIKQPAQTPQGDNKVTQQQNKEPIITSTNKTGTLEINSNNYFYNIHSKEDKTSVYYYKKISNGKILFAPIITGYGLGYLINEYQTMAVDYIGSRPDTNKTIVVLENGEAVADSSGGFQITKKAVIAVLNPGQTVEDVLNNQPPLSQPTQQPTQALDTSEPKTSVDTARENLGNNKLFKPQKWQNRLSRLNDENILGLNEMAKRNPILKRTLDHLDAMIKANMSDEELNNLVAEQLKPKNREVDRTIQEQSSIDKEVEVIEKLLPQLNQEDRVRIVDSLISIPNGRAWGQFKDGVITLYRNAARGTSYHEAFHFVFNTLMTDEELNRAFDAAEKRYGNLSPIELEERLAEEFREYMQNEETFIGRLKNLWSKLKTLLNHFNSNWNYLDRVYADISRGNYSNREVKDNQDTRNRIVPTLESMQYSVDNYVNRSNVNPTKESKNKAWGKLADSWKRDGYRIRGHYDSSYKGYKVTSVTPIFTTKELRQYHANRLTYRNLDQESKNYLNERHITPQEYEKMTLKEKEVLFRCMY